MPAITPTYMKYLFLPLLFLCALPTRAQQSEASPLSAWLIKPSLGYQYSGGDLESRFGNNLSAGLGVGYKTNENWIFSIDGQYIFGQNVRNVGQLLHPVLSDKGAIFNQTGNYATFDVAERGYYGTFDISKTFNLLSVNPNSGINLLLGAGYITHWVHITNPGQDSPQINGEYLKGYDERSGGMLLKQSIGYMYLSHNRRINLRLSFEVLEGFTTNYRKFSYSTGRPVEGRKLDLLYGFRLQWVLPIYSEGGATYYYH